MLFGCLFQALEQFVMPHLRTYWNQLQQVLDDTTQSNALLQDEAYQVYGALLVRKVTAPLHIIGSYPELELDASKFSSAGIVKKEELSN